MKPMQPMQPMKPMQTNANQCNQRKQWNQCNQCKPMQPMQPMGADQQRLAQLAPQLYGGDISTLGSAGATQQAQAQAILDAQRETERLEAYEPYERLGYLGSGIASIASGAPGQYQSTVMPNPTPLQNALGIAGVGAGLMTGYGDYLKGKYYQG